MAIQNRIWMPVLLLCLILLTGCSSKSSLPTPKCVGGGGYRSSWIEPLLQRAEAEINAPLDTRNYEHPGCLDSECEWPNVCNTLCEIWLQTGVCLFEDIPPKELKNHAQAIIELYRSCILDTQRPPSSQIAKFGIIDAIDLMDSEYSLVAYYIFNVYFLMEPVEPRHAGTLRGALKMAAECGDSQEVSTKVIAELHEHEDDFFYPPFPVSYDVLLTSPPSAEVRIEIKKRMKKWMEKTRDYWVWDVLREKYCLAMPSPCPVKDLLPLYRIAPLFNPKVLLEQRPSKLLQVK